MALTENEIDLYSRQILVPAMGGRGQGLLAAASVQILGGGTAPAFAASYLAGAGVGRIVWVSSAGPSAETALAPLEQRRPDTRLVRRARVAPTGVIFDVTIAETGPRSDMSAAAATGAAAGLARAGATRTGAARPDSARVLAGVPARTGEIGLHAGDLAGLLLVPARAGYCLACLGWPSDETETADGRRRSASQSALEDPLLGAMAALATLGWLARIAPDATDDRARALLLEDGEWRDAAPRRRTGPCPRCLSRTTRLSPP